MICPSCKVDSPLGAKYCAQCGASLDPIVERLQAAVKSEVERAIDARLKDQKVVELDTSIAVAERISNWAKLFGAILGIPLAALVISLGFLGIRTYADFTGLIRGAQTALTAELDQSTKEADNALAKAKEASVASGKLEVLVNQTEKSLSDVSSKLSEVATLGSEVDQLRSRAGEVQQQLAQASELTNDVKGLTSKVSALEERFSKLGRVAIITNKPDEAKRLTDFLAAYGGETSVLSTSELAKLSLTDPEVVIIAPDTAESWEKQPTWALTRIFENYKLVGVGKGGAQLFAALGLEISSGQAMHAHSDDPLTVELAETLKSPQPVPNADGAVLVADKGSDTIGVYDEGSPDIVGFEGVARWNKFQNHWPIARQGNYLLWGFNASADQLTDAGKRLFVNLLINHKLHPAVPLSQAVKKHDYAQPGVKTDRLNAQFPRNTYYFRVDQNGQVTAKLSWMPPDRQLALILNGPPGQDKRLFARKDGTSPLEVGLEGSDVQALAGRDWRVDVTSFDKGLGDVVLNYSLDLSFPISAADRR